MLRPGGRFFLRRWGGCIYDRVIGFFYAGGLVYLVFVFCVDPENWRGRVFTSVGFFLVFFLG